MAIRDARVTLQDAATGLSVEIERLGLLFVEVEPAVDRVGRVVVAQHHVATADVADPLAARLDGVLEGDAAHPRDLHPAEGRRVAPHRHERRDLRRAVLANMTDEKGGENSYGEPDASHADLWLDFVEGRGGRRRPHRQPIGEIRALIAHFQDVAAEGTVEEALAAFYAYESQVPRIAAEKDRGLRDLYSADAKSRTYFTLHTTADVYHSQVWRKQLEKRIQANPETAEKALAAAESAAKALWSALDGIEARRQSRVAA